MHVQSCCLRLYSKPIAFLSFPSRKRLYNLSSPCRSPLEVTLNLVILRRSLQDDKQAYKKVMHLLFVLFWGSLITDKRHNSKMPVCFYASMNLVFKVGIYHLRVEPPLQGTCCAWAPNSTHEFIMRFGRLRKKAFFWSSPGFTFCACPQRLLAIYLSATTRINKKRLKHSGTCGKMTSSSIIVWAIR